MSNVKCQMWCQYLVKNSIALHYIKCPPQDCEMWNVKCQMWCNYLAWNSNVYHQDCYQKYYYINSKNCWSGPSWAGPPPICGAPPLSLPPPPSTNMTDDFAQQSSRVSGILVRAQDKYEYKHKYNHKTNTNWVTNTMCTDAVMFTSPLYILYCAELCTVAL